MNPMVSIIMPAYNAEKYIVEAIDSVIIQTYENWELLVVNDGSTDKTESLVLAFEDDRIHYFKQNNGGVSSARNLALKEMKGDFFCFLDADDYFTSNSLQSRLIVFEEDKRLSFVDGHIEVFDDKTKKVVSVFKPSFKGIPTQDLVRLTGRCFFSITWLIKKDNKVDYFFREDISHGEDLLFFIEISSTSNYSFTAEKIMHYRKGNVSAMSNVVALEKGYWQLYNEVKKKSFVSLLDVLIMHLKIKKIMCLEYVNSKRYALALKSLLK